MKQNNASIQQSENLQYGSFIPWGTLFNEHGKRVLNELQLTIYA